MAQTSDSGTIGEVEGEEKDRIALKKAIRILFARYSIGVLFLTRKAGPGTRKASAQLGEEHNLVPSGAMDLGGLYEWAFYGNYEDINGKRWGWQPNQRNPIEAASQWLQSYRTTNDKGFIIRTDNSVKGLPIVIFWESGEPDCDGTMNTSTPLNVGTYIVHGGSCSPVIKFDPKITVFPPTVHPGSSISDAGGKPAAQKEPQSRICPQITGQGEGSSAPIPDDIQHQFKDKAAEEQATSLEANEKAQLIHADAVSANLIIQGDPFYSKVLLLTSRYVTVVVVNPFHLRGSDNQTNCGDYTVKPPCNPLLTNRNWLIEGVDHQIKEGSYHTILKLGLRAPGVVMNKDVPLGGRDSCGIDYLNGRLKP